MHVFPSSLSVRHASTIFVPLYNVACAGMLLCSYRVTLIVLHLLSTMFAVLLERVLGLLLLI